MGDDTFQISSPRPTLIEVYVVPGELGTTVLDILLVSARAGTVDSHLKDPGVLTQSSIK